MSRRRKRKLSLGATAGHDVLPDCEVTGKQTFRSERAAKLAYRHAGFRIHVYPCEYCGHYHASNHEKA